METPQVSAIQAAYEIMKAKGPITNNDLYAALGKQGHTLKGRTIAYSLIQRGLAKKAGEKDGNVMFAVTDTKPEFSAPRKMKRKYTRRKNQLAKVELLTPSRVDDSNSHSKEVLEDMARIHNAQSILKNSVAMLQFAETLDRVGPDQMIMMLAQMERMGR